jgi:hypothetical protein
MLIVEFINEYNNSIILLMIKVLKKIWNEFICGGYWPGISSVIIVYSALKITDIQISSLY